MSSSREDLRRVLESASEVFWDFEMWVDEPNTFFEGKTPRQMIEEGKAKQVLAFLEALKDGTHQ